ncbi:MAG: hypothetical protein PWQ43_1270 [Rikenellaceae bacterium]|nr:hypothetical protein [Rikenellaceae bacterium]MDN5356328.1 hypothetical protein [Rikenellaceae bacterium]
MFVYQNNYVIFQYKPLKPKDYEKKFLPFYINNINLMLSF